MGSNIWIDSEGEAKFWNSVPLLTVKKAFFKKGNIVRALMKIVANGITYNFRETAQGGAVIVPPDYSAIEFISPDGRIDYKTLLNGSLGNALTESINILEVEPVPAWDKFVLWLSGTGVLSNLESHNGKYEIQSIDGTSSMEINEPTFQNLSNMVSLLEAVKTAASQAHGHQLSMYQLDSAAFGWAIKLTYVEKEGEEPYTFKLGFIFRE